MPARWYRETDKAPDTPGAFSYAEGAGPWLRLVVWPHRSLPRRGFVWFIFGTFLLFLVPLLAVLGTVILWVLLAFILATVGLLWFFLERSYADAALREDLALWTDRIALSRTNPRGPRQEWAANPYWVQVELHPSGGPVENYLTLKGDGRRVELGAFLSPEEREALYRELTEALDQVKRR